MMSDIIQGLQKKKVPEEHRKSMYEVLVPAMEDMDWDTQDECIGEDKALDAVFRERHPHWFEDEE